MRTTTFLLIILLLGLAAPFSSLQETMAQQTETKPTATLPTSAKYAGSYKIDSWHDLEGRKLYHFFFLHPGGEFLLGAEWPGRETSRAVGDWSVKGEHLSLNGTINLNTNQGNWRVPFVRTYKIVVTDKGLGLKPLPKKNRYGLLGWPNKFFFFRNTPSPNLPSGELPQQEKNILALIKSLKEDWKQVAQ